MKDKGRRGRGEMEEGRQVGGEHGMREGVSEGGTEDRGGGEIKEGRAWDEGGSAGGREGMVGEKRENKEGESME